MKKHLLLLSLLAGTVSAFAQANFRPGYVVPLSGDTLRGEIQIAQGSKATQVCRFRPNAEGQISEYTPGNSKGYGDTSVQFEAQALPKGADQQMVFMEVVEPGPATLYLFSSATDPNAFFIRLNSGRLRPLRGGSQPVKIGGQQYQAYITTYKDTLSEAFQSCAKAKKQAQQIRFSAGELAKVTRVYNACLGSETPISTPTARRGHIDFGLVAGVGLINKLTTGNGDGSSFYDEEFKSDPFYTLGFTLTTKLGRVNSHFSAATGLLYEAGRKYQKSETYYTGLLTQTKLALDYLAMPLLIRYEIGEGLLQPYLEAGGVIRFVTNVSQDEITFNVNNPSGYKEAYLDNYQALSLAATAGAGIKIGKPGSRIWSVGVRADQGGGPFTLVKGSTQRNLLMLISYQFGR